MTDTRFDPYHPPVSGLEPREGRGRVWRKKRRVVMQEGSILPARCYRCNSDRVVERRTLKVFWTAPWVMPLVVVTLFVPGIGLLLVVAELLILGAVRLRKKTLVDYSVCHRHMTQLHALSLVVMFLIVAGLSLSGWVLFGPSDTAGTAVQGAMLWAGIILPLLGITVALVGRIFLQLATWRYSGDEIWLSGSGTPFLDSLENDSE